MVKVRVYQIDQQGRVNLELVSGGSGTGTSTMDTSGGDSRPPRRFDRGGSRGGGGHRGSSYARSESRTYNRPTEQPTENADPNAAAPAPRKPRIEIE